jgi:predicted DNA-binding transcriptional regulator YafY
MLYRRSLEIEQRLDAAIRLIRTGRFSTPKLAEELHVSIPTVSRYVTALRARGHDIRAERRRDTWRFVLVRKPAAQGDANTFPVSRAAS